MKYYVQETFSPKINSSVRTYFFFNILIDNASWPGAVYNFEMKDYNMRH